MALKIVKKRDNNNTHRTTANTVWQPIALNIEKFPKDLSNFAVKPIELFALKELFENKPSAEELCKML